MAVAPEDLHACASTVVTALAPVAAADWSVPAGDLEWDCRRTLDHVPDALLLYAAHLAARASSGLPAVRDGDVAATPRRLLRVLDTAAAILAEVVATAPPDARAFHPAGMADPEGFCAMGCDEILVHGWDLGRGLGVEVRPSEELAGRIVARLFPWVPAGGWETLLWANGRVVLGGSDRLGPDWYWHCAPLAEWDGTPNRRQAPPRWR